jgi:hypothetical protein
MSRQRKTVVQELKDDFRQKHSQHQQNMDIVREAQALLRKIDARLAPRLDLAFVFNGLLLMPWRGIKRAVRMSAESVARHFRTQLDFEGIFGLYGDVFDHVAKWAKFWIGMLFRWVWDELCNALSSALFLALMMLGYVLGAWLLLAVIYFVLTH